MNNLAICISGSLRSIEYCINNFINNIIIPNKKNMNIIIFYFIPNDKNADKIKNINLPNMIYRIEDDIELSIQNIIWYGRDINTKIDNVSTSGINGYLQQLYGIEQSYLMMKNYEEINNINFDYILRVRSDVIFKNPLNFNKFPNEKLIIPNFHHWGGINDRFAFGNRKLMITYMNMYSNLINLSKEYFKKNKKYLILKNAEYFAKINLENNKIPYLLENNILFNRVRMDGKISSDAF
jgi:hypothetical protein